jgi:hypothetical protein
MSLNGREYKEEKILEENGSKLQKINEIEKSEFIVIAKEISKRYSVEGLQQCFAEVAGVYCDSV